MFGNAIILKFHHPYAHDISPKIKIMVVKTQNKDTLRLWKNNELMLLKEYNAFENICNGG